MRNGEYLNISQREVLLTRGLVKGEFTSASGELLQQKFDFDKIDANSELFQYAMLGLTRCVDQNFDDFHGILTVAKGATRVGDQLSNFFGVEHVRSAYYTDEKGEKHFSVSHVDEVDKVVIIDDVFTRGTTTSKVAVAANNRGIEAVGVAVVLDRSGHDSPKIFGSVPVASVIQQQLN